MTAHPGPLAPISLRILTTCRRARPPSKHPRELTDAYISGDEIGSTLDPRGEVHYSRILDSAFHSERDHLVHIRALPFGTRQLVLNIAAARVRPAKMRSGLRDSFRGDVRARACFLTDH